MAITDVLRPVSVRKAGAGTSVPSGTLAAVTSDNSDATYIDFNTADSGSNWSLRVGSHTPTANYQRHQVRGRIRIRTDAGSCVEDIDLGRGSDDYLEYDTVPVTSSFAEQAGSWYSNTGYGLDTAGALADLNIGGGWLDDVATAVEARTAECYVDIDTRHRPDYSPEVQDAAGADQSGGTVTDTNQPSIVIGGVDYDGLPALAWTVSIRSGSPAGPEVFADGGSGTPPGTVNVTTGLDDGAYAVLISVTSTIRGADPFEHAETILFSVENTVPPPSPPLVSVTEEGGGYRVTWTDPGGQAWDNDYVVAEVYRDDCNGTQRIATVPDGLNGSYLDLAIPQLDPQPVPGPDCEVSSEPCDITYRVRYWGYVSTFIEVPDAIPEEMILGWPGTVGSIPSGWSRVTALDGYYPRGSLLTGAPVATGGAASHSHTTPGHEHWIAAHDHAVGGSTGTSNTSTTSARFNGASQPQADQPHSHARASSTGDAGGQYSGTENPGTATANNEPLTRTVIWVKSDGAQANYAVGLLGWSAESVSGWTTDADSNARFLRGAPAAGNGGANSGSATHVHGVNAHIHTGFSHDHGISATGLSNPASSQEAGFGSSTPRWLPRHTHPMDVGANGTGNLVSNTGGNTSAGSLEPPHRRLRVLRNTGGGAQTRIIGLYLGTVAGVDSLLTVCDGSNGTPDMRSYFARDAGPDSINSTGGFTAHTHTTPTHGHVNATHAHTTNVLTSTTGSFEAPSSGDLGSSPTTGHDHTSANTSTAQPAVTTVTSGVTNLVSSLPPYHDVHFVRLDGEPAGGPLPVPELKATDFSSATVPALTHADGLDRLASLTTTMAVATDRTHTFPRLVADSTPLNGGLHTVSTTLAGEDVMLTIAAEGKPAIDALEALLASDRLYFSPLGGTSGWFAPAGWSVTAPVTNVKVVQVPMVRQDWPPTADPMEYL